MNLHQTPGQYRKLLLTVYLLFITFLFCLPGSALPKAGWLDKIWFDKWVHVGMFTVAGLLGYWNGIKKWPWVSVLIVYGGLVELVQDAWIKNRSMDAGDWMADVAGVLFSTWIWGRYIKK